uniref:DUF3778 domain-containing protein n=1 Tax=Oryza glumipatula TaxID=40148 RepID=A0A0D9Y4Y4_9ORYZ
MRKAWKITEIFFLCCVCLSLSHHNRVVLSALSPLPPRRRLLLLFFPRWSGEYGGKPAPVETGKGDDDDVRCGGSDLQGCRRRVFLRSSYSRGVFLPRGVYASSPGLYDQIAGLLLLLLLLSC